MWDSQSRLYPSVRRYCGRYRTNSAIKWQLSIILTSYKVLIPLSPDSYRLLMLVIHAHISSLQYARLRKWSYECVLFSNWSGTNILAQAVYRNVVFWLWQSNRISGPLFAELANQMPSSSSCVCNRQIDITNLSYYVDTMYVTRSSVRIYWKHYQEREGGLHSRWEDKSRLKLSRTAITNGSTSKHSAMRWSCFRKTSKHLESRQRNWNNLNRWKRPAGNMYVLKGWCTGWLQAKVFG